MRNILTKFKAAKNKLSIILMVTLFFCSIFTAAYTYYSINDATLQLGPDPANIIKLVLLDLILVLALVTVVVRNIFKNLSSKNNNYSGGRVKRRIIIMFCLVAAIPTIIISIFSAYFFNFGLQSWFHNRVTNILTYSINLSQAYNSDFVSQLKASTIEVSDELSDMYYDLIHEPHLFNKVLNQQATMRNLNEAIVFHKSSRSILAQTSMSFSLAFSNIPGHLLAQADKGEIVEIKSDPTRVRMLVKLQDYNDTYLLVGRLLDPNLADYSTKIESAVEDYARLNSQLLSLQIQFSIAFILVALILLLLAISGGVLFATNLIKPINRLLIATEQLQKGNLSFRVKAHGTNDDELFILSKAFNEMVAQLDQNQKDLLIAQRSLAWSDVARMVAHEIKNPLTPIQLACNIMKQKFIKDVNDPVAFEKYISTILKHTSDIGVILNEFITFARMPSPKMEIGDIIILIKDFIESHKLLHDKIDYHFESNVESLEWLYDSMQINQVMINLFKNAEEAIENSKRPGIISTYIKVENDNLIISVSDTGDGFLHTDISKASEPYFTTRAKGTGLGLAIVRKIVVDHNGTIVIKNIETDNKIVGAEIKLTFELQKLKNILT